MLIDLQLHSTYSDGYLTPTELAQYAAKQGIKVAALTDHNTVGGLEEFRRACKKYKIKSINGMEVYCKFKTRKVNILWYNYDAENAELHKLMRETHLRRRRLMRGLLEELANRGFKINIDEIFDTHSRYVPTNHVVDIFKANSKNMARIRKELKLKNPREEEIIREYFNNKKIYKLRNSHISLERLLNLKKKIGGQIIICHPAKDRYVYREQVAEYKKMGVDGIEIMSPHHSIGAVIYLQALCREYDMIETGGSDFHRDEGEGYLIQNAIEYFKIDSNLLRGIKKVIG